MTKRVFIVGDDRALGFLFAENDSVTRALWVDEELGDDGPQERTFHGTIIELECDTDDEIEAIWRAYSALGGYSACTAEAFETIGLFGDANDPFLEEPSGN